MLRELSDAPQAARKVAFAQLLAGPTETEDERLSIARELAHRDFPDVESARRFWGRNAGEDWRRALFSQPWLDGGLRRLFGGSRPVPLFSAIKGLDYQLEHSGGGHLSYFRGRVLDDDDFADGNPHPEYYSVVMGVKNPPLFLFLAVAGIAAAFVPRRGWSVLRALALLALPVLAFFVFSLGSLLMGVKYVLPVFGFLAVLGAGIAVWWPRLALTLAALAALEGALFQPHQLMYYNVFAGGPRGGPAITVVGDDWGQDARALGRFYARYRDAIDRTGGLYYEPYSAGDVAAFGLEGAHRVYGELEGIVAVHAVDYYRRRAHFRWLDGFEPFARLGHALWIYDTRGGAPGSDPRADWNAGD